MSSEPIDAFACCARDVFTQYHLKNKELILTQPDTKGPAHVPKIGEMLTDNRRPIEEPALIIGGGVAGLYIAMMLESIKKVKIPFVIVEAKDHVGGRLFTHSFNKGVKDWEYYDVGAMRFPDTPFMKRTFQLAEKVNVKQIPYYFQADHTFKFFNGVHVPRLPGEPPLDENDPYNINTTTEFNRQSYIPSPDFQKFLNPEVIADFLGDLMMEFKEDFRTHSGDYKEAMRLTIAKYDKYTMRSYLSEVVKLPAAVINVMETFDKSTGWFDRALVETIVEDLAFNWLSKATDLDWVCFDGGSSSLPKAMERYLNDRGSIVNDNTMVTSIVDPNLNQPGLHRGGLTVDTLSTDGKKQSKTYPAVFCTAPLSTLGVMDLSKSGIHSNYAQWSGIRELQYGPAIKIGIRFETNWWDEKFKIVGGQSFTDLPLRTIVYPSYPQHGTKSRVLIVSYCWTQDAERLGAFIDNDTGALKGRGLEIILNMLKQVHGIDKDEDLGVVDAFAYDWLRDPLTMGGFAFFGPQQFEDPIWVQMSEPACNGQLFFAGEASSACHAWVAGALESAWTAVVAFLKTYDYDEKVKDEFYALWGGSEYWEKDNFYESISTHVKVGLAKGGITSSRPAA